MGLDTSHGAWHGAYSAFHRWRCEIAHVAGFPPLEMMEGFFNVEKYRHDIDPLSEYSGLRHLIQNKSLPIKWDKFRNDPLVNLLYHSDCDGDLSYGQCGKIAKRLRELLPLIDGDLGGHIGDVKEKTLTFIKGLELAHSKKKNSFLDEKRPIRESQASRGGEAWIWRSSSAIQQSIVLGGCVQIRLQRGCEG